MGVRRVGQVWEVKSAGYGRNEFDVGQEGPKAEVAEGGDRGQVRLGE